MEETNKAKRSGTEPRFRDIDFSFLERVAEAFSEGSEKYEEGLPVWEKNWRKGDDKFFFEVIDHAIKHLYLFKERMMLEFGESSGIDEKLVYEEDHLGHCGANLVMLSYWQDKVEKRLNQEAEDKIRKLIEARNNNPNPIQGNLQHAASTGFSVLRSLGINV